MKKVLAIGASNSKKSINKILATYIANQIESATVISMDWEAFELPLFSPDLQETSGIPTNAHQFKALIDDADGIVLSLAEYNGLHTAAFKNLWDWVSRIDMKLWGNKPLFLAAASPGQRGGGNVLRITKDIMPHFGGNVIVDFSFPMFFHNFQEGEVVNPALKTDLMQKIHLFQQSI